MKRMDLEEYIEISTGKLDANKADTNGKYPFFTCSNEPLKINQYSYDCECVLVAGNGDLNVKYYKGKFDAYQRTYIIKSKNDTELDTKYLYYLIDSNIEQLRRNAIGGVIKYIKLKNLTDIKFQNRSITDQRSIVTQLDKVQKIIDRRKKQIEELDELIQSQFAQMLKNSSNKEYYDWSDVFSTTTGKLDANAMVENGKYPFFTCAKECFWIDDFAFDCEALLLAGNNAAGVYDVKHYKGKFNAYQRTYVLTLKNSQWKYEVFKLQLEEKLQYLKHQSKGSNTRYLTIAILNSLQFIVPTIDLQNQFAEIVKQIDKQKEEIQKNLKEMQQLKESLMNQYFRIPYNKITKTES